jgi:protein-disulfide isomerase
MRSRAILNLRSLIISIVLLIIPLQLGRGNIFASSRSPDQDLKIQKAIEDTNSANEVTNNSIYAKDMVFGDKNAEILLIEYFTPTCAICRNYHLEVFPQIKSKYIDTGKIAYVMREAVGNRVDLDASILARCKGNTGSYLKLIGGLLKEQDLWAYRKDYKDLLTKIAKDQGLTEPEYEACLANNGTIGIF